MPREQLSRVAAYTWPRAGVPACRVRDRGAGRAAAIGMSTWLRIAAGRIVASTAVLLQVPEVRGLRRDAVPEAVPVP